MLSSEARSWFTVVLVGARNPQNIGAAARAMQDFGFADLRVVNAFAPPFEAAQLEATSAVSAGEVMRSARLFTSLADAIADCSVVAGTTAIGGRELTRPVLSLVDGAPLLREALLQTPAAHESGQAADYATIQSSPRVALLFGSEKTGLTNEQLSHCSLLLTVPLFAPEGRHLSMNLGQAVAVCLYELGREGFEGARALPDQSRPLPATAADCERLTELVLRTMQHSDYTRRFPANARPEIVRSLVSRLGVEAKQTATWMGLFRLILRSLPAAEESAKEEPA